MFKDWIRLIAKGLSYVGCLYLAIVLGVVFFINHKAVIHAAQVEGLSRLTPSFDYWAAYIGDPDRGAKPYLEECRNYHYEVSRIIRSEKGQAFAMEGVCAYEVGREGEAIRAFENSVDVMPVFFWNYYNLGMIWLNKGEFRKAGEAFSDAIALDPKLTFLVISRSKIYRDVLYSIPGREYDFEKSVVEGYRQAAGLVRVCAMCAQRPDSASCQNRIKFHMKVF